MLVCTTLVVVAGRDNLAFWWLQNSYVCTELLVRRRLGSQLGQHIGHV